MELERDPWRTIRSSKNSLSGFMFLFGTPLKWFLRTSKRPNSRVDHIGPVAFGHVSIGVLEKPMDHMLLSPSGGASMKPTPKKGSTKTCTPKTVNRLRCSSRSLSGTVQAESQKGVHHHFGSTLSDTKDPKLFICQALPSLDKESQFQRCALGASLLPLLHILTIKCFHENVKTSYVQGSLCRGLHCGRRDITVFLKNMCVATGGLE